MAVNFLNLGRLYSVGDGRFFCVLSCGGDAFSMLRRSGSGLFIFCSVYWVNLIRYWDRLNQCQLGQYHYNKSVGARGVGKLGGGNKTLTTFHLSEKKGLPKRNPMVAGTKARESMEIFERSSELIHVCFSKVKTKI